MSLCYRAGAKAGVHCFQGDASEPIGAGTQTGSGRFNEVEMLSDSLMDNQGVRRTDAVIKLISE